MEEENEQLDYDEEELKSALKKAQQLQEVIAKEQREKELMPVTTCFPNTATEIKHIGTTAVTATSSPPKCYVNPNFKRREQQHRGSSYSLSANNRPFAKVGGYPYSVQHIYHQQVPQSTFYTAIQPPQFSHFLPAVSHSSSTHIVNGGIQQFPHPASHLASTVPNSNIYINPSVFNVSSISHINQQSSTAGGLNWDSMVDEFVKKTLTGQARRRRYSRSRSSSTLSSLSNHSRSYSRSRSRSPTSSDTKKRRRNSHSPRRKRTIPNKSKQEQTTIECARAIGLDEEYLKKVEEQQRLRDEIAQKKSRHRKELYAREKAAEEAKKKEIEVHKTRQQTEKTKKDEDGQPKTVVNKLRPYLAVVVTNLKGVNDAPRRLAEIVCKIGPVKKVWREGPSDVYVIFEKHEDAKKFMQQYIGDTTIFGRPIDVTMKKVFLNIASLA